jgi:hypothetical protein
MSWIIAVIIAVILLWLHHLYQKRIDREEMNDTNRVSSISNPKSLWDYLRIRFRKYLDFTEAELSADKMIISNPKGESFIFHKVLTDIIVTYKLNGVEKKSWKFPFWVHENTAFNSIDEYYKSINLPIEVEVEYGVRSVYKLNTKYGLWNSGFSPRKQDKLTSPIYDEIDDRYVYARGWNRLINVSINGLVGLINIHGQTLLSCNYNAIVAHNIIDEYNTALYNDITLFDEFNVKSELLADWLKENTEEGILEDSYSIENLYSLINCLDTFIVSKGLKYGVVSYYDIELIPFIYDEIIWVNDLLFIAKKNGRYGLIWDKNQIVLPFDFIKIGDLKMSFNGTLKDGPKAQLFRVSKSLSTEAVINGLGEIVIPYMDTAKLEQELVRLYY